MRTGSRRLSLLIALVALAAARPSAAGAADEGDVGVVDNIVEVEATASLAGMRGVYDGDPSGEDECVWKLVISNDLDFGVYEPNGERLYSDTGRWFQLNCEDGPVLVNGYIGVPEGGAFTGNDLLEQAFRRLDPAAPGWGASPDGVDVPMVVQLPTNLWVDDTYWAGTFAARAVTPSGRIWAEARAFPATATWSTGDGATVVCDGAGDSGANATVPPCSHTYRHSTAGSDGLAMSVTVSFNVQGNTSLAPDPVALGQIARTSEPVTIQVGEIQAIETSGT